MVPKSVLLANLTTSELSVHFFCLCFLRGLVVNRIQPLCQNIITGNTHFKDEYGHAMIELRDTIVGDTYGENGF